MSCRTFGTTSKREKKQQKNCATNKSMKISFQWKIQPTFYITREMLRHAYSMYLWSESNCWCSPDKRRTPAKKLERCLHSFALNPSILENVSRANKMNESACPIVSEFTTITNIHSDTWSFEMIHFIWICFRKFSSKLFKILKCLAIF